MATQIPLKRTVLETSLWIMLACQAGDLISTLIGLSRGKPEANPLLLFISHSIGIFATVIVAKISLMMVCLWSYQQIRNLTAPYFSYGLTAIFLLTSCIYLITIARNLVIIYA